jgi:hypothetical protein
MSISGEIGRPIHEHDPSRIEIGPPNLKWVPLNAVNILPQVRTDYPEEAMIQLKDSLLEKDENGRVQINLLHPPTLNIFNSRTQARNYVRDLNACWDLDHNVTAVKPYDTGKGPLYAALIAGHRRILAIELAIDEIGINPDDVDVMFSVHEGMDFYAAMDLQYKENEHTRLNPWQDARAIASRYRAGVERGEFNSFADCARSMGVTAEKVSDAWRFYQLPMFLQDDVRDLRDTRFTYGKAIKIYEIAKALSASVMSKWARNELGLDEESMDEFNLELQKSSLEEIQRQMTQEDKDYIDYQLRDHRRSIARRSMEEVDKYVRVNVGDITDSSGITDFLILEDQELVDRSKNLKKLANTRNGTYIALASLLNQLVDDHDLIKRMNDESSIDQRVLRLVHSPSGRKVLARIVGLLDEIDGVIPDSLLSEALKIERTELVSRLTELREIEKLPEIVSSTADLYSRTNGNQGALIV